MLAVVQWSLIATRGVCVLFGWKLTMVSSMMVAIVTVIGIATMMHWMFGYRKAITEGADHETALRDHFVDW